MLEPSVEQYSIEMEDPRVRLIIRRRDDGTLDLRLARCSPSADLTNPTNWHLTQAGFRLSRGAAIELRAALREMLSV